jgi:hypothetical protein
VAAEIFHILYFEVGVHSRSPSFEIYVNFDLVT